MTEACDIYWKEVANNSQVRHLCKNNMNNRKWNQPTSKIEVSVLLKEIIKGYVG